MEIQGRIKQVLEARSGVSQSSGKSWMTQEFVLDYFWWPNQQNPTQMKFRVFGEERLKNYDLHENDEVKITFHVEAHEHNGNWYNEILVTQCQKVGASARPTEPAPSQSAAAAQQPANPAPGQTEAEANEEADDLPF